MVSGICPHIKKEGNLPPDFLDQKGFLKEDKLVNLLEWGLSQGAEIFPQLIPLLQPSLEAASSVDLPLPSYMLDSSPGRRLLLKCRLPFSFKMSEDAALNVLLKFMEKSQTNLEDLLTDMKVITKADDFLGEVDQASCFDKGKTLDQILSLSVPIPLDGLSTHLFESFEKISSERIKDTSSTCGDLILVLLRRLVANEVPLASAAKAISLLQKLSNNFSAQITDDLGSWFERYRVKNQEAIKEWNSQQSQDSSFDIDDFGFEDNE